MGKTYYSKSLLVALAALAASPSAVAQKPLGAPKAQLSQKLTPEQRQRLVEEFHRKNPTVATTRYLGAKKTTLQQAHKPGSPAQIRSKSQQTKMPLRAPSGTKIWANVYFSSAWANANQYAYYSFSPASTMTPTMLNTASMDYIFAKQGVQMKDSKLYGIYADMTYAEYGTDYVNPYCTVFDTTSWSELTGESDYVPNMDCKFIAQETAIATDGTVYGEFYKTDLSGYEWGTVDYSTMNRTTIGDATHKFVALGVTSKNVLYGVATDGNLYKISTTDGSETLVGATGLTLTVTDEYGSANYAQTGEIDQRNDVFYWAAIDASANTGLYSVDLSTGTATKLGDFDGTTGMVGMVIPQDLADEGAPARATNMTVDFAGESLTGNVAFTAPTTTYAGAALDGELTYTVSVNGVEAAIGTTTAGASVTVPVTVARSASYQFTVVTKNAAGTSPRASVTKWVGKEAPNPATGVTMMVDNNYNVTVFWTPPTTTVSGVALSNVTYDVYRCTKSSKTLVAESITENSFSEQLKEPELTEYHYEVYAKNGDALSEVASSEGKIFGSAIKPDYFEDFKSADAEKLYTKIDSNGDGKTWSYVASDHCMRTNYSSASADDDWFVTPRIHLTPDRTYTVSFSAKNRYPKFPNNLEVKWGTGNTPAGLTNTLLPSTALDSKYVKYSYVISPTVEGDYYVGFHDIAPQADYGVIYLDSIAVTSNALLVAPKAPTNFTATADPNGELKVTLQFTVPSTDVKGTALSSVDKVVIRRNAETIKEYGKTEAGKTITYVDENVPVVGFNAYEVAAYTGDDCGDWALATAWVGADTPVNPANVQLHDNVSTVLTTWDKFSSKGQNGGYVNPDEVQVNVYGIESDGYQMYLGDLLATSDPGATSVDLPVDPEAAVTTDGSQSLMTVAARTEGRNESDVSNYVFSSDLVVGPSIKLPFFESFKNGYVDNGLCWVESNDAVVNRANAAVWSTSTWDSSDNDGGCVMWTAYASADNTYSIAAGDETAFSLAKVALAGSSKPRLTFDAYGVANMKGKLVVSVKLPDGTEDEMTAIDFSSISKSGWAKYSVDLTPYKNERYVICKFNGVSQSSNITMAVDNICILDDVENNLSGTAVTVADNLKAGRKADVKVGVKNLGTKPASNYTVALYSGDKKLAETSVTDQLASMEETQIDLSFDVAPNAKGTMTLKGLVSYAADVNSSDDATEEKTVSVSPVRTPRINDLTATAASGAAALSWTAPVAPENETTTETFEDYADWTTSFGDWTTINGNPEAEACNLFSQYDSPFLRQKFAFTIFNGHTMIQEFDGIEAQPGFAAHDGDKFAGVPYEWTVDGFVDGDNWLVSPLLSGNGQTVTFYAGNLQFDDTYAYNETFDFLISFTDNNKDSFTKIGSTYVADGQILSTEGANWKEISVFVPKGTKYFAIHQTTPSANTYLFGIDDVTFEAGTECVDDNITGYNIYRDGEKIGSVSGTTLSYDDAGIDDDHYYNVTAVFTDAQGNVTESSFSNTASLSLSIEAIENAMNASSYDVYTLDGQAVMLNAKSLKGLKKGAYIINDRKFILK